MWLCIPARTQNIALNLDIDALSNQLKYNENNTIDSIKNNNDSGYSSGDIISVILSPSDSNPSNINEFDRTLYKFEYKFSVSFYFLNKKTETSFIVSFDFNCRLLVYHNLIQSLSNLTHVW